MLSPIWAAVILLIALAVGAVLQNTFLFFSAIAGSRSSGYPQIDGLRGYLALLVFLTHAVSIRAWMETGVWDWPASAFYCLAGTVPVSLFFMITGFLFFAKMRTKRLAAIPFLKARLLRLAPLYLFAAVLLFAIVAQRTGWQLRTDTGSLMLGAAKWLCLGLGDRPDLNGLPNTYLINAPVWTLWYEWMFYIALPILAFAPGLRATVVIGFVVALACQYTDSGYVVLNFVAGAFVSHLVALSPDLPLLRRREVGAAALALVAMLPVMNSVYYGPWHTLLLTPLFVVIVYGNSLFGALSIGPAKILGAISYSIYLLHCLVLQVVMQVANAIDPVATMGVAEYWSIIAVATAAILLISSVTFRFIEYPWMASRSTPTARAVLDLGTPLSALALLERPQLQRRKSS